MPKIAYIEKRFTASSLELIEYANEIIEEYQAEGYDLTLRQLYYQFVARDLIPNKQSEYKRLGSVVNDARLAGHIDWSAIVDRTRNLRTLSHWNNPGEIIATCARQFKLDKWSVEHQEYRPEVWIEKDALVGVISDVCNEFDVPYFSCRGYISQSEMWAAAERATDWELGGQIPFVIHLGDHDPSGIDMTRDIEDRFNIFGSNVPLSRVALNMNQVDEYEPPPNPTKLSDSRASGYISRYGYDSWELDALSPQVITSVIRGRLDELRNDEAWEKAVALEIEYREQLEKLV